MHVTKVAITLISSVYHIHYVGWSKYWDTWTSESEILKKNKENVEKMENLMAECKCQRFFYKTRLG